METLLIRADASVAIGTGHVMRCLALAQAWQDTGGKVVLVTAESTPAVQERMRCENVALEFIEVGDLRSDGLQLAELARKHRASWIVVDGYQFDEEYQQALKDAGLQVLLVDDLGRQMQYSADVVLNYNLHARERDYAERATRTRLLLGPGYAMLRREFNRWRGWSREISERGQRILVAMGGSDPENATLKVIDVLSRIQGGEIEIRVIAGGSNPYIQLLEEAVAKAKVAMTLDRNVSDMPSAMAWADLAITSAGTICWELCYMRLPSLLIHLAENQRPVAERLDRCEAAIHLGGPEEISTEKTIRCIQRVIEDRATRVRLSEKARMLVDGKGTGRVLLALKSREINLRPADEGDKEPLWHWANDPEVRAASFCSAEIVWEEHCRWFEQKLGDRNTKLLIALNGERKPVGQIRLERVRAGEAEIHLSIAKEYRGKGYAASLIEQGTLEAFSEAGISRVNALVKPQNIASSRAFERADFRQVQPCEVRGLPALHFVRDRERQEFRETPSSMHASGSFHG